MALAQPPAAPDLTAFIPMDRRQALARGAGLPDRAAGCALFVDVSGFVPLTAALVRTLGPRRGAEALTGYLNRVYDVLIAEVHRYGGSVISFSGDAITCWFDGAQLAAPARAAVTCTSAMRQALHAFEAVALPGGAAVTLSIKAGVAAGPVRRFLVGDPSVQRIDVIAGATVARMALAGAQAGPGEIVLDAPAAAELGAHARVRPLAGGHAVLDALHDPAPPHPWPPLAPGALDADQVRPWLLPAVYARLREGLGEFLAELRPVTALFVRFGGIDYDRDAAAGARLDRYVRWVQSVLTRFDGSLIDLTIGDKGSYLYAVCGAPLAHEDDPARACAAALELARPPASFEYAGPPQIGASQGLMRAGVYGGSTRRTYGVLGEDANLAARLMLEARPGEVLVAEHVRKAAPAFEWERLAALPLKGFARPVPVSRLAGRAPMFAVEPAYSGALIGREAELARLEDFVAPIFAGRFAGLAVVHGEAGLGKSHLVHELRVRLQAEHDLSWFTCPAEPILRQSLHPLRHFLGEHFAQSAADPAENRRRFDERLDALLAALPAGAAELGRELGAARSLLGALVNLYWPGSLYEQLDPPLRFAATLHAGELFVKAESLRRPVIIHVEDAHWLDPDSVEGLTRLLAQAGDYPFAVLLTSRPRDDGSPLDPGVAPGLPRVDVDLGALAPPGVQALAAQILAQRAASPGGPDAGASSAAPVAHELARFLIEKTGGNPFFIEQLALDLHERGLVQLEGGAWHLHDQARVEVPATVNAVLVARLDRLAARVKAVVQTASVLGQEFELRVLTQMLHSDEQVAGIVKQAEAEAVWSALSEMRYLFRHALLRDAAYEMQVAARLREVHRLAGEAIEHVYGGNLTAYAADLAYHYGKADDPERERRYARLAGLQAAARFANGEALAALDRALFLTPPGDAAERYDLLLARERVYDLQGLRQAQLADLETLGALAGALSDPARQAACALRLANYAEVTGDYPAAIAAARQTTRLAEAAALPEAAAAGYLQWGRILWRQAQHAGARERLERGLALARAAGARDLEADCLSVLGLVAWHRGEYVEARARHAESLQLYQAVHDRRGQSAALDHLGFVAFSLGRYAEARAYAEQALRLCREIGNQHAESIYVGFLGLLAHYLDEGGASLDYSEQALVIARRIGARREIGYCYNNLGLALLGLGRAADAADAFAEAVAVRRASGEPNLAIESLAGLARACLALGQVARAREHVAQILKHLETGSLDGTDDPQVIYLTCYQALAETGDPRALPLLAAAVDLLHSRAARISDSALRHSFLWNVRAHAELQARWDAEQARRAHRSDTPTEENPS